jgi:hypothetical protein
LRRWRRGSPLNYRSVWFADVRIKHEKTRRYAFYRLPLFATIRYKPQLKLGRKLGLP